MPGPLRSPRLLRGGRVLPQVGICRRRFRKVAATAKTETPAMMAAKRNMMTRHKMSKTPMQVVCWEAIPAKSQEAAIECGAFDDCTLFENCVHDTQELTEYHVPRHLEECLSCVKPKSTPVPNSACGPQAHKYSTYSCVGLPPLTPSWSWEISSAR